MNDHQAPAKTYDPAEVEGRLAGWWEQHRIGASDPDAPGAPFSIVIPPPNVTAALHVGHALNMSVQDVLVRRARMRGRNVVLLPGTDHAGIATQTVVERQLAAEGLSRRDLGREAFVERVWRWREETGGAILAQLRRLGYSADWDREAFTFDGPRSAAVREVFCALHEQGLIYRGKRIINWCPRNLTALSDIEVEHAEEPGELAYLRYPASESPDDASSGVVVATTRVETMLGDTGVAVHPSDDRYRHLVGRTVRLPLMDRDIPVVADDAVDPEFGTGAVKVTPAHDSNDFAIGQRAGLPAIDVMTDEAVINDAGGPYAGLDRYTARDRVKADLDGLGLLVRVENRSHSVGHCQRCGEVVEPRLSDQWFVAVTPLAEAAAKAVREGRTRFVPERMTKPFLAWLENLQDWCISRQLWWGHRIPAWYDATGEITVLRADPSPAEVEERGLVQDPDVLDTWFSSALWPITTMGWPVKTPELARWYPTSVLVTAYDINTFWVSRMLMFCLRFTGETPFHTVLNHGLVRDEHGRKMAKSVGNVVDPLDLIDRYGADALRLALLRAAAPGQDVPMAEDWVEGARRFANKVWNAARLVLAGTSELDPAFVVPEQLLEVEDRWILSRLEAARAGADAAYGEHDIGRAARLLQAFFRDEYCDWYLELAKLRDDPVAALVSAHVLDRSLRLLHPVIPFVTEELWRALVRADERASIARSAWPEPAPERSDPEAERQLDALRDTVVAVRRFRLDHALAPNLRPEVLALIPVEHRAALEAGVEGIRRLAGLGSWTFVDAPPAQDGLGQVVVAGAELFIPLAGLVDLDEERARLRKELATAEQEIARAGGKLGNQGFVTKAATEVVDAERTKLAEWTTVRDTLRARLTLLG